MAKSKRRVVRGRVPGVSVPATAKSAAHSRVAGWKHGLRATVVTPLEARAAHVEKQFGDGAAAVLEAYMGGLSGNLDGIDVINATALGETELLRRSFVDDIRTRGPVIEEKMVNSEGAEIGVRVKPHPLIEPTRWMNEQLGHTAADTQLSRKSRGEGAVNAAMAARLARDAMLRGHDKSGMPPPPPAKKELGP
jgi:hypothetical protein